MKKFISYFLLVISLLVLSIIMFSSCNSYQKQLTKFNSFADQYPDALAQKCTEKFPVKDSVGKSVVKIDSIKANNKNLQPKVDSLQKIADDYRQHLADDTAKGNPCADQAKKDQIAYNKLYSELTALKAAYKPCVPTTITKTVTTPIYQVDEAALKVATDKYQVQRDSTNQLKAKLLDAQDTAKTRLVWIFILGGILAGLVVLDVLKFMGKISI